MSSLSPQTVRICEGLAGLKEGLTCCMREVGKKGLLEQSAWLQVSCPLAAFFYQFENTENTFFRSV